MLAEQHGIVLGQRVELQKCELLGSVACCRGRQTKEMRHTSARSQETTADFSPPASAANPEYALPGPPRRSSSSWDSVAKLSSSRPEPNRSTAKKSLVECQVDRDTVVYDTIPAFAECHWSLSPGRRRPETSLLLHERRTTARIPGAGNHRPTHGQGLKKRPSPLAPPHNAYGAMLCDFNPNRTRGRRRGKVPSRDRSPAPERQLRQRS